MDRKRVFVANAGFFINIRSFMRSISLMMVFGPYSVQRGLASTISIFVIGIIVYCMTYCNHFKFTLFCMLT